MLWIIWATMLVSIFYYRFKLAPMPRGLPPAEPFTYPGVYLSPIPLLIATVVRWLVLPRAVRFQQILVCLVVGLAMSEAVTFFGLFLVPAELSETRAILFTLSTFGILQFIPLYPIPQDKPDAAPDFAPPHM